MDTDPPHVWRTLSSLQYRLAAAGWETEKGKKKGRDVKANFDMYPGERSHDLRTLGVKVVFTPFAGEDLGMVLECA